MPCFFFILGCIGSSYYGEFVKIGKVVSIYLVKLLPENVLLALNRSIQSGLTPTDSTRIIAADPWSRPIDGANIKGTVMPEGKSILRSQKRPGQVVG